MFRPKNGSDVMVPERLAGPGGGGPAKVGVAVISGDQTVANFSMAIAALEYMVGRLGLPFFLFGMKGDPLAVARNSAIDQARAHGCDWLLMVDSSVTFPPNALPRLLNAAQEHKLDIVGPTTCRKIPPHDNLAVPLQGPAETKGSVVEVQALPPVFMLIRLEAIEKMKKPYFRYLTCEEGGEVPELLRGAGPEDGTARVFDDSLAFCAAARAAGARIWLDAELSQFMVTWGECGYRLNGAPEGELQFERVEVGAMPTTAKEAAPAPEGPKIEVAR